jgi:hypothetical protein
MHSNGIRPQKRLTSDAVRLSPRAVKSPPRPPRSMPFRALAAQATPASISRRQISS